MRRTPDLTRLFNQAVQKARTSDYRPMLTGRVQDDGSVTLAGAPSGKTWVRATENSRELTAAWGYCSQINIQVMVGYAADGTLEIKGADYSATAAQLGDALQSVFTPPIIGELSNISIAGMNFKPGRVRPYGSGLQVTADSFFHSGGYWDMDGDPLNLSSSVPGSAGQARWVIVALDPVTNMLTATNGPVISGSVRQLTVGDTAAIATAEGFLRLGAVALEYGQATIDNTTRIVDIREYLSAGSAMVSGQAPVDLYYDADVTLTDGDISSETRISIDASAGPVTVTLPPLATMNSFPVSVTKIDASANPVTVKGDGAETIIGSAQIIIEYQWTTVTLIYNSAAPGSEWILV